MGTDGWTASSGRTQNFFDGSSSHLNSAGAMSETTRMDGPAGLKLPSQHNTLAAPSGMSN